MKFPALFITALTLFTAAAMASITPGGLLASQTALAASRPTVSQPSSFSYEKAACPFDTKGLDARRLECGWLTVPENRGEDDGRTIKLAVTILRGDASSAHASPVLLLEDGPGQSAPLHGAMTGTHAAIPDRDLVVLDQRGTGLSKPRLCPWLNATYGGEMGLPGGYIQTLDLSAGQAALMRAGALRTCRDVLASQSVDPTAYNPVESAADVEALRKALGVRQWNLLGTGYGARVAQLVMRKYPGSVRAVAMLPREPVDDTGRARQSVAAFAAALQRLFRLCRQDARCAAAYPHLGRTFHRTIAQLRQRPLRLPLDSRLLGRDTYVMNARDFVVLVRLGLASGGFVGKIPWLIEAVSRRDKAVLGPLVEGLVKSTVSQPDPHARFSWGAYYSGRCYANRTTKKQWLDASANGPDLRLIGFVDSACRVWGTAPAPEKLLQPVKSDIPVLAISGALDPSVSAAALKHILAGFTHAKHVVFPHGTHNPGPHNIHCMLGLLKAFYRSPEESLATACVGHLPSFKFTLPDRRRDTSNT